MLQNILSLKGRFRVAQIVRTRTALLADPQMLPAPITNCGEVMRKFIRRAAVIATGSTALVVAGLATASEASAVSPGGRLYYGSLSCTTEQAKVGGTIGYDGIARCAGVQTGWWKVKVICWSGASSTGTYATNEYGGTQTSVVLSNCYGGVSDIQVVPWYSW